MDTAQWPQDIGLVKPPMEEIVSNNTCSNPNNNNMLERRARPHKEQALNCPRCNSTNTKFCYYNNYSLTQPRYFCKTCRRYWTEGGSLRNVPVGGGSRKNRRSSSISSSSSASATSKKLLSHDHLITPPPIITNNISKSSSSQNPKIHETQDLNLAFPTTDHHYHSMSEFVELPNNMDQSNSNNQQQIPITSSSTSQLSALEFLRSSGISSSRGLSSFMPMPVQDSTTVYTSAGFALQDFKPTLNFGTVDGLGGGGYGSIQGVHHHQESNNSGRPLFPFEDLRQVTSTTTDHDQFDHQNRGGHQGDSNGYWSGMLGGGSW